jgi:transposase-like protein
LGGRKDIMNHDQKKNGTSLLGRRYDETFKRHAVELSLRGDRRIAAVAEELGIKPWTLRLWRQRYAPQPAGGGVGSNTSAGMNRRTSAAKPLSAFASLTSFRAFARPAAGTAENPGRCSVSPISSITRSPAPRPRTAM